MFLFSPSNHVVLAEEANPYRAAVEMNNLSTLLEPLVSSREFSSASNIEREAISPIHLKAFIRGQGRVDIRLTIKRNMAPLKSFRAQGREVVDNLTPLLLQGSITIGHGIGRTVPARLEPAALSVINDKLRVSFLGRVKGSRGRQRLYTLHTKLKMGSAREVHVSSLPASSLRGGGCDSSTEDIDGDHQIERRVASALGDEVSLQSVTLSRVVTLSTDADPEWFARFGAESNAEIARIINSAEAIFFKHFAITFRVVKQHTYTDSSPYVTTNASILLSQFINNPENPTNLSDISEDLSTAVDMKHMFSGKDFDGATLGVARVGTVCSSPELAYGISQYYLYDATAGIFTHEIAHNFGAYHDASDRTSIMYPIISIPYSQRFSDASKREIRSFLARNAGCMSLEQVDRSDIPLNGTELELPLTPPKREISIRRQKSSSIRMLKFTGRVTTRDGLGVSDQIIQLYLGGDLVATTNSDSKGKFSFRISAGKIKGRGLEVYASTEDGWSTSAAIRVSAIVSRSRTRR